VQTAGNRDVARALAAALAVPPSVDDDAEADRAHVHGFHAYPARMHPGTAAGLVRAVSREGDIVLDPFCGSGTVLVEAMIASRRAIGTDLNPLAIRLARLKTAPFQASQGDELVTAARHIAASADQRRERRAGATQRYPSDDVATFDPHVLLELDSLRAGIHGYDGSAEVREALWLVLSAILMKVSRQASDTSSARASRRIAAGFPARFFCRKAEELAHRLAELRALLPAAQGTLAPPQDSTRPQPSRGPAVRVELDDATRLRTVAASTVDAVVTSPPYAATYDYVAHHALRLRWLGMDARTMSAELGSRRRYAELSPEGARVAWSRELGSVLRALSRVCRKGAQVVLLMADSAVRGQALRADAVVAEIAPAAGFGPLARASQRRPHFHRPSEEAFADAPRAEHAIALEKR
jgi:hypothetical protein